MRETWRWFGDSDKVSLGDARQVGALGIVSSLHDQYDGRSWKLEDILAHKAKILAAGMTWDVCESIPIHGSIKQRTGPYRKYINAWKDNLANVGRAGVKTVCYNFMPIVDWTRTDLSYELPNKCRALRFDMAEFVAYDVFILKRPHASDNYAEKILAAAETRLPLLQGEKLEKLEANIIGGLPAREASYTREEMLATLKEFEGMTPAQLRQNLVDFLQEIMPVAEEFDIKMGIHPDDPPFSLFGLPRIVSTTEDVRALLAANRSPANGLTLCCGSFGSRADNKLPTMASEFAEKIHFLHLRNVVVEEDGSFYEAEHLDGGTDMMAVITAVLEEEKRRSLAGRTDHQIPMRPDHGHLMLDDLGKHGINPGYSCLGRMKGLAELRGVTRALAWQANGRKNHLDTSFR